MFMRVFDITEHFTAILDFLVQIFLWMSANSIKIGEKSFTLELFCGSMALTLFAEMFIMAFVPNTSGNDFNDDSGEDWIDTDYDD